MKSTTASAPLVDAFDSPLWLVAPQAWPALARTVDAVPVAQAAEDRRVLVCLPGQGLAWPSAECAPVLAAGPVADANRAGLPVTREGAVAVVELGGYMLKTAGLSQYRRYGITSTKDVRAGLAAAAADAGVAEVLLVVDSPGGLVSGTAELADDLRDVNAAKPVTVQVDGTAASAAYYVASQASRVVVGRADYVGSIGVLLVAYDLTRAMANYGVEAVVLRSGNLKAIGVPGAPITEDQEAHLQHLVDLHYSEFKAAVARGRPGLSPGGLDRVADGRVLLGEEGVAAGLADAVGTFADTFAEIAPRAAQAVKGRAPRRSRAGAQAAALRARAAAGPGVTVRPPASTTSPREFPAPAAPRRGRFGSLGEFAKAVHAEWVGGPPDPRLSALRLPEADPGETP